MKEYNITTKQIINQEQLDDLLDAAINVCGYWVDLLEYGVHPTEDVDAMSQALSHGGTLKFTIEEPFTDGGDTTFELTTEKLISGIEKYGSVYFEDYDGYDADAIIQMALFGDIIYG